MQSTQKTLAMWVIIAVVAVIMFQAYESRQKNIVRNFTYPTFIKALNNNEIDKVILHPDSGEISGEVKPEFKDKYNKAIKFKFESEVSPEIREMIEAKGIIPSFEKSQNSALTSFFLNYLPVILIFIIVIFLIRQFQSNSGKAMSFGKSRARLLVENKKKITFKDVAGVEEGKEELQEIVAFLKSPKKFTRLGGRIPKGVLLVGSPGTGKTLLARAVAGEAEVPFYSISGSDFVEMFVGVGASRVRDLFEQGKKNAPCLIFIDEIDAVGRHRGAGMGGGHDEREQTLNQLLVEMDGFESNEGVILIAATNRPDVLDPALLRPGRFDRRIIVSKPDLKGREDILKVHVRKTPLSDNVNLGKIARGTPGFSGADLENLVNEAALFAARNDKHTIVMSDFEKAKDKVLMGSERRSMIVSEEDRKITAYHEAGHTLVGKLLSGLDPIHKVSIIPRGMALGVTQTLPEEDTLNLFFSKAKNTIAFMFGGRVAEEVIFKDFTTGASNDIERATDLARKMVCEWGMSKKIGPLALEKNAGPVFLGMQSQQNHREYSEAKAQEVDAEIKRFIDEGYQKAQDVIQKNIEALHRLAQALLLHETIDGEEVNLLIKEDALESINKKREETQKKLDEENLKAAKESEAKEKSQNQEDGKKEASSEPIGDPGPITA